MRALARYDFVRDELAFGYNASDDLPASRVLADGIGHATPKVRCSWPCYGQWASLPHTWFHHRQGPAARRHYRCGLQLAPPSILHSWVEVLFEDRWVRLEGLSFDKPYLSALQAEFADVEGSFAALVWPQPAYSHLWSTGGAKTPYPERGYGPGALGCMAHRTRFTGPR